MFFWGVIFVIVDGVVGVGVFGVVVDSVLVSIDVGWEGWRREYSSTRTGRELKRLISGL